MQPDSVLIIAWAAALAFICFTFYRGDVTITAIKRRLKLDVADGASYTRMMGILTISILVSVVAGALSYRAWETFVSFVVGATSASVLIELGLLLMMRSWVTWWRNYEKSWALSTD